MLAVTLSVFDPNADILRLASARFFRSIPREVEEAAITFTPRFSSAPRPVAR
jgi:hypothetical protein